MNTQSRFNLSVFFLVMVVAMPAYYSHAETLYVDSRDGIDTNTGTKEKPLRTIGKAAKLVNKSTEAGPSMIMIQPGVYSLEKCVKFANQRTFTETDRLTIKASVLPDDPNWTPEKIPIILSVENPRKQTGSGAITETYSIKIQLSYVTIQGLKFLGNPTLNNMHGCVERIGKELDDLLIKQCVFIGDRNGADIYAATLATGDRFVVEHCIFKGCGASVVWWDGFDEIGGHGCAMRYCIVDSVYMSGPWTCQTAEDFEFHNNIVTNSEYFWMRKPGDKQKYRIRNCAIVNNTHWSGYGVASGPTGETGDNIVFEEKGIIKSGTVVCETNEQSKQYLHPKTNSVGSQLGAGLFLKQPGY